MSDRLEPVGVVGLGLLGSGIASCLASRGIQVIGYDRSAAHTRECRRALRPTLAALGRRGVVSREAVRQAPQRFSVASSLEGLAPCAFVIESVTEDLRLKRRLYEQLERILSLRAIIASNTSSFPITSIQEGRKHPSRFIGMHWAEPAAITRYLEVTRGRQTSARTVRLTNTLGLKCGKEPAILKRDIRGFISNRLMYAMFREALYLVEAGVADVRMVDRSFRNDIGWWATLAGPFRWMDLTGISPYATVAEGLFPELSCTRSLPKLLRAMRARGAEGVSNGRGFYSYDRRTSRTWQRAWTDFAYDIRVLVCRYEKRVEF